MSAERPEISVIMSVYNPERQDYTLEAVRSILNQTFGDYEFIIYNDGSNAETASFLKGLQGLDPRIRIAESAENHGLAYSLNECIRLSRGRFLARMDADDISLPERFEKQLAFLKTHPEYQWCGCNARLIDDEGIWGMLTYPKEPKAEDYLPYSPFAHPTVLFRSELFAEGHRYLASKETLRCEDYELFMRLYLEGYRGCNLEEILFHYRKDRRTQMRQKMKFRVNEAKIRRRYFKKMGLLNTRGWLYVLRPVAAGLVPEGLLARLKRRAYYE